jgi:hypothetical protein
MVERDHSFQCSAEYGCVYVSRSFFFQTNGIARFDGLNFFS